MEELQSGVAAGTKNCFLMFSYSQVGYTVLTNGVPHVRLAFVPGGHKVWPAANAVEKGARINRKRTHVCFHVDKTRMSSLPPEGNAAIESSPD